MTRTRAVVIGNGIAGFRAASTLRHLSEEVEVTLISMEEGPLYSACALPDYVSGGIPRERVFVKSRQDYQDLGIQTRLGRAVKEIDTGAKRVILEDGEVLSFDKLILATGSDAAVLGEVKEGVFKLKTLRDADGILKHDGKRAVVIGGGAIGIEIGIALHRRGCKVTVLEMLDQVLPLGLDQKGADKVKTVLEERGIEVLNGERGERLLGGERVEGLLTNKRELSCDTLIWAVGMRPRVDLARRAGIGLGTRGGIRVNARMETNVPDVYACGDCIESSDLLTGESYLNLFWHNAAHQGGVAARNCVGLTTEYPGSQSTLNVDVFGVHVTGFGFTEAALYRFKEIKAFEGKLPPLSIVERDKGGSYYRLVIAGDRCMGGQFINVPQMEQAMGLLWSFMARKRSVDGLLRILENEALLRHKPWARRLKPFFA